MSERIICPIQRVEKGWIDYNGHMNMAFYSVMFDRALDHVFDMLDIGTEYVTSEGGSCFTLEAHLNYERELVLDDAVDIHWQLLDWDTKRLHYFEQMYNKETGELAATSEQIAIHVDMNSRRSAPFPAAVQDKLEALMAKHRGLDIPPQVGHRIGIPRKTD